ncbi:hypothetical protein BGX38DRAFT_1167297 [Terfezia claveryi]|nr:hypothetical protein BGX38DRAFT_1167297 [Terfezia claveryi]
MRRPTQPSTGGSNPDALGPAELQLLQKLRDCPRDHDLDYTEQAQASLLKDLFYSLACNKPEYLNYFFPNGAPAEGSPTAWNLSQAQGAIEGAEYSTAAKGKPCGHIFKSGEATYRCKTCSHDDTCVLCSKCFESSDHTGHAVYVSISTGNMGCCDCGDAEAWRVPVKCAIHTAICGNDDMDTEGPTALLPDDLKTGIRATIAAAIDYLCDVVSCSPEQLRLPKSEEVIRKDEEMSRLGSRYQELGEEEPEKAKFALILWNDEKHTVSEVEDQIARACKTTKQFAKDRAQETDGIGRSIIIDSQDVTDLLRISKIIEQIKVTVTIRSARDTFREQMCGTIIEWLNDLAGCTVGGDSFILRNIICEELLGTWRVGSPAWNTDIGKHGIDDHSLEEAQQQAKWVRRMILPLEIVAVAAQVQTQGDDMEMDDLENEEDADERVDEEEEDEGDLEGGMDNLDEIMELDEMDQFLPSLGEPDPTPPIPQGGPVGPLPAAGTADAPRVPPTPGNNHLRQTGFTPPKHWVEVPATIITPHPLPPYENLRARVRLDWLILFDLRLWKKARIDLRDLYISTVVAIPEFKRILGLRFSSLYTMLSQLYLIADREPDHSIINLSLQILTTPSITAEVVRKGNFLTSLMAILYTFLTTRQVGYPTDINPKAPLAFDAGPLTNKRMHHFFQDLHYLVGSEYVQERLRVEERYMLQFLDLVRLHQGICPNIRALDQHLEYEAEAWISASLITREINKLVRQFSDAFRPDKAPDTTGLRRAISTAARYAIIDSMGWDENRYSITEVKGVTEFKTTTAFDFDTSATGNPRTHEVVKFCVDYQPLSFHHALHYTLSWLIEAGKSMSVEELRNLLSFYWEDIRSVIPSTAERRELDDLVLAVFDYPLRVCAWLCEMKVGMWVRNGFSLRHQMQTYKGVSQKDLTHNRDIFLLQTSLVVLDPSRVLANMINRFNLDGWMRGDYSPPKPWDEIQTLDMAEEFLNLLIIILSERLCLLPHSEEPDLLALQFKREITHILCFKPLTFSELCARMPDRLHTHDLFQDTLEKMTIYNPPNGLSDSGTFELKEKYLLELDPYVVQFTKNQREEAEGIYRTRMAKITGRPKAEIVFEPKLRPIKSGVFSGLVNFTKTRIFAQIIYYSLAYAIQFDPQKAAILGTRVETYLQVGLHLCLLATLEDSPDDSESFVVNALECEAMGGPPPGADGHKNITSALYQLGKSDSFKTLWPRISLILCHMRQRQPTLFDKICPWARELSQEASKGRSPEEIEVERKKKLSRERQQKVMEEFRNKQQKFIISNGMDLDEEGFTDEDGMDDVTEKCWEYPSGSCSVCKASVTADDRIYGTFAFITDSNLLRQTDFTDPDYFYEVAISPDSLDEETPRPFGVASMNRGTVRKLASDGSEIFVERQVLGRGFPPQSVRRGTFSTGCGHIIHYDCFEHWYESTKRRNPHHIARVHPENFEKKEFICPLCKALGNTFLPIVWKSKHEVTTGILQSEAPLMNWLGTVIGPLVSRLGKAVQSGGNDRNATRVQELFYEYSKKNMTENVAEKVHLLLADAFERINMGTESSRHQPTTYEVNQVYELHKIYRRMRDTLQANQIFSNLPVPEGGNASDLTNCDSLARILGYSISAAEIAQRGVDLDMGTTLIDKISNQTLTHLRVMAETVFTYFAIGSLHGKDQSATLQQFKTMQDQQLRSLFVGHRQISPEPIFEKKTPPLLSNDIFVFLAECSVCLVPALHIEFHQIMHLCYLVEIVKAAITIGRDFMATYRKLDKAKLDKLQEIRNSKKSPSASPHLKILWQFLQFMSESLIIPELDPTLLQTFRDMVGKYVTTFLRKATILVHVRYGVDFTTKGLPDSVDVSEQERLSVALGLPSVDEIFSVCAARSSEGRLLREMIEGWYGHWHFSRDADGIGNPLRLTHPCIYELVGLPLHYDTLVEEAMKRKCPKSKGDLTDPSVCLFCGDIFCSQALCCLVERNGVKIGGCNQHMEKCQGDVGMFINIRKCHVLFLHQQKGAWAAAPYLDKHGETDSGLRRNRQLFLHQRRYDALQRNIWLQHGIPSIISRRLEAEVNTGGWETI